jgi:hypothetical protein
VLETAGPHWAAERVRGLRTISNALTIGKAFDLLSDGAFAYAKQQGWCRSAADFDFARCFTDPFYSRMSGGHVRAACTLDLLRRKQDKLAREDFFAALSDHAGLQPAAGWRMTMPCAHSSWWPTRQAGQTTGSMISRLRVRDSLHFLTGTSSPCLSVYKPVRLGSQLLDSGPPAGEGCDGESLFWRHERLHRATLKDYARLKAGFDEERKAMQRRFVAAADAAADSALQTCWEEHRQTIPAWTSRVCEQSGKRGHSSRFLSYWEKQNRLDHFPADTL